MSAVLAVIGVAVLLLLLAGGLLVLEARYRYAGRRVTPRRRMTAWGRILAKAGR